MEHNISCCKQKSSIYFPSGIVKQVLVTARRFNVTVGSHVDQNRNAELLHRYLWTVFFDNEMVTKI